MHDARPALARDREAGKAIHEGVGQGPLGVAGAGVVVATMGVVGLPVVAAASGIGFAIGRWLSK